MNKSIILQFRADFAEAVKALELKYQVNLSLGSISYAETSLTAKMSVVSVSKDGEKLEDPLILKQKNAKAGWALACELQNGFSIKNVPDEIIGRDITLTSGQRGKIVDFDSKKFKYPFIVLVDDVAYRFPTAHIKSFS